MVAAGRDYGGDWGPAEKQLLPAEIVLGTLRVGLPDVERQGSARRVCIALTGTASSLRLTVSNDGDGMPAEASVARLCGRRAEIAGPGGHTTRHWAYGEKAPR
ncbi:hypothetical protein GCM10022419_114840 [Nonomuraea rosea]|uniref:ATP-binding protein n=1 Tax=Nonomuraea rosea TaxID=638574 RepID=A0ABP6ZII2_9ACTN